MFEIVSVRVGGKPFDDWEQIAVQASVKDAARSMTMAVPDTPGAPMWPSVFKGGPEITVSTRAGDDAPAKGGGGELLFTGYVEHIVPDLQGDQFFVRISARAKGADAIDSSVDHTKPDYVKSDVLKVARDQDRFGIGFKIDFKPDGFDRWRPNVGHTLFAALAPLAEDENATLAGQADGSIKITRAGAAAKSQGAPLVEGQNIPIISATFDESGQHSQVKAHGQNFEGNGASAIALMGQATNSTVKRFRPLHEHHDRQTSKAKLKVRAERRRDKEQGEGVRAQVTMKTWRDDSGKLFEPGNLIFVYSPSMSLSQNLLIESVAYSQTGDDSTGTRCVLSLVDPRAHGGKAGGVNKSGSEWGGDYSDGQ